MTRQTKSARAEVWRERLVRFESSGLSVKEFCSQEAVSEPSFYQWRKKLAGRRRKRRPTAKSVFQPVRVAPAAGVLSIVFPGGARLEAPADNLDLARLVVREVVAALRVERSGDA